MTRDEVLALMKSSKTTQEWDDNCDKVKAAVRDGRITEADDEYPRYWHADVILSGLATKV